MVDLLKIKQAARDDVTDFSKMFFQKYGVYPIVSYKIVENNEQLKIVPMYRVEKIVDKLIKDHYGNEYSVWTRNRYKFIIEYRQVMFKILYDMGYNYLAIGKYFKFAHCTILYSAKVINDYLNIKDNQITNIYNQILYEISKESGAFDIIQWDDPRKINP